jgi:ribosomal-protein-alanine N-acetyltransferase
MVKLRKFSLADLDRVLEIEKVSFLNREVWSRNYFKNLYQKYPEGFIIAENGNEIIGYTIGQVRNESAEIISLAVDPTWRRKGVGTILTNSLIDHFKEKRLKEIFLHVRTKNKEGISFYQKLGFKILKTIKNYYRNGDSAFLMRKEI